MVQDDLKLSHVAARVLADLTSIHVCMIAALAISVLHPGLISARMQLRPEDAVHYYVSVFLFLSLLFPGVFLLTGQYAHPHAHDGPRMVSLFRGVALSLLLFSIVSFALYRRQQIPQGYIPLFCGLAIFSLAVPRVVKATLQRRFQGKSAAIVRRPSSDGNGLSMGDADYIVSCPVRNMLAAGRNVAVMYSL